MGIRVCLDSHTCRGPSTTVGEPAHARFDKKRGMRPVVLECSKSLAKKHLNTGHGSCGTHPYSTGEATDMRFGALTAGIMPAVGGASAKESYAFG